MGFFFFLKKNNNLEHVKWFHRGWYETRMQYGHKCTFRLDRYLINLKVLGFLMAKKKTQAFCCIQHFSGYIYLARASKWMVGNYAELEWVDAICS